MQNYYVGNKELLLEPCGGGVVSHSKKDFALIESDDKLIMKGPPKSQATAVPIIGVLTFIVMVFAFFKMYSLAADIPKVVIVAGIVTYWGIVVFVYLSMNKHVKAGDWFELDIKTGKIYFPRINALDNIENFLMVQSLRCKYDNAVTVALIFTCGTGYNRYPLFLYEGLNIDSYLIDLSKKLGGHFQKIEYSKNKPVISGYDLEK